MGSIHRGTVRSLRSLFQLPSVPTEPPSSNRSSRSLQQQQQQQQQQQRYHHHHHTVPAKEIKKGTVQSIRAIFTSPNGLTSTDSNSSTSHRHKPSYSSSAASSPAVSRTNTLKSDAVGEQHNDDDDHLMDNRLETASRNAVVNSKPHGILGRWRQRTTGALQPSQYPALSKTSSIYSSTSTLLSKPLPKAPTEPPKRKNLLRKITARVFSSRNSAPAEDDNIPPLPAMPSVPKQSPQASSSPPQQQLPSVAAPPPPPPKRSLLASWLRPDPVPKQQAPAHKKQTTDDTPTKKSADHPVTTEIDVEPAAPSVVGRIWKSFKRMVTGKKTSRVGVL
ncbi:hypothetical protein BX666DRAFT_1946394 [Dichotomocladium elegans]|nr:hypothetical protein BX666DRAFT_1946394 [Dichotomocladium elegans]